MLRNRAREQKAAQTEGPYPEESSHRSEAVGLRHRIVAAIKGSVGFSESAALSAV